MKKKLSKLIKEITWRVVILKRKLQKNNNVSVSRSSLISLLAPPPNIIPKDLISDFSIKGKMNILYLFYDDRVLYTEKLHNSNKKYKSVFRQLNVGTFRYYDREGESLLMALEKYSIKGKDVIIWGLAGCNCEAIAVWKGAKKVYVVDYNKPICDHEKIEVMNHDEITRKEIKADFAISYSSFEHDGLGRYGDPISPNGDLHAMQDAHKFLKNDGMLFLGVPLGKDCIVWNAHRIYGKNRLPLLLKGWQLIDVFDNNTKNSLEYPFDLPTGDYIQNVMVLKKLAYDFPDDEYLLCKNLKMENIIYERINRVIYEYKRT